MNTVTQNYNATRGLQNLVVERNPISNIVFEMSDDGIMEHYAGVDKNGKIFSYDKRLGNEPTYSGIHRESYNGLTEYYELRIKDAEYSIDNLKDKNYSLKNTILFGSISASIVILILLIALLYSHGV